MFGLRSAEQIEVGWPGRVLPMLASAGERLPSGRAWGFEFKWDGMRALAAVGGGQLRLIGRRGTELAGRFPELAGLSEAIKDRRVLLDGELVVLARGRPSFAQLQPRMHLTDRGRIAQLARQTPAAYLIFDLLWEGSQDLTGVTYEHRRARLEAMGLKGEQWDVPPMRIDAGRAMSEAAQRMGLEGVIAKRLSSVYRQGERSRDWVKVKLVHAQEFVVGGWRASRSGRANEVGSLAVGYYERAGASGSEGVKGLRFAGLVGSGLTQADHRQLWGLLHEREQARSPFVDALPGDVRLVRPELVVHVVFAQWTPGGVLRQPSYKGLRVDKPAEEVVREAMAE